jgi:DNA (cytosine-5)-methyltransferase 1
MPISWPEPTHGPGLIPYRSAAECIDWSIPAPSIFGRAKPLVEATLRRIARGVRRFVLETGDPWIVSQYGTSTGSAIHDPLPTVTAGSRHEHLAVPYLIPCSHGGDERTWSAEEPMRTITASSRSPFQLVVPSLIHTSNGERPGQAPRIYDITKPLGTVVAGGVKQGLVTAHLMKNYGGHEGPGQSVRSPFGTITTRDHHALVVCSTIGDKRAEVREFMRRYGGIESTTVRAGGEEYELADIGMRLLVPRELARGHDFGDEHALEKDVHGNPVTKTDQIRLIGNSVPPMLAEAVARANLNASGAQAVA